MNYMNVVPGHEYEYQMYEDKIVRLLHEDRMTRQQMSGWELYKLILPGGINYGYYYSTADFNEHLENIEFDFSNELIRQNQPDMDINEFFDNMNRTRDLVRTELWELVEFLK